MMVDKPLSFERNLPTLSPGARSMVYTSVDSLRDTLRHRSNAADLNAALDRCLHHGYRTKAKLIIARMKQLAKKEAA